ncbi:hypothetical protein Slin15195_G073260 [Septoria linicola]|uniref:Uncharacterized protein n=1 Tax=Septoria linicola TaxID=215465 RepID=A0A9Q9AQR8_9PEZI|nr:hypothetical protein Slin15195_G073260 [Septoria linicola]
MSPMSQNHIQELEGRVESLQTRLAHEEQHRKDRDDSFQRNARRGQTISNVQKLHESLGHQYSRHGEYQSFAPDLGVVIALQQHCLQIYQDQGRTTDLGLVQRIQALVTKLLNRNSIPPIQAEVTAFLEQLRKDPPGAISKLEEIASSAQDTKLPTRPPLRLASIDEVLNRAQNEPEDDDESYMDIQPFENSSFQTSSQSGSALPMPRSSLAAATEGLDTGGGLQRFNLSTAGGRAFAEACGRPTAAQPSDFQLIMDSVKVPDFSRPKWSQSPSSPDL